MADELINGLTQKQWDQINARVEAWYKQYTNQVDDSVIIESVNEIYSRLNRPNPKVYIARSPREALIMNAHLEAYFNESGKVPKEDYEVIQKYVEARKLDWKSYIPASHSRHLKLHWECARAGWLGTHDIVGVELDEQELATYTKWVTAIETMIAYTEVCVASRKPIRDHLIDGQSQKELHNEDGPALEWADGTKAWAIRGVQVDEQIVMAPETQTIQQIDDEENIEVKRIRIERFGWERYLDEKKAKVIDERENAIEGTYEVLVECDDMKILLCRCPSKTPPQVFPLEVDPSCNTCKEAQDYLHGGDSSRIIART